MMDWRAQQQLEEERAAKLYEILDRVAKALGVEDAQILSRELGMLDIWKEAA